MTNNTRVDEWTGCYDLGWTGGLICEAAFSHPAKFSRGLIFRIIEHALKDGLIQPGSIILDPFGGVALGALPALQNGLNWIGVELEPRFVELGRQNIALWNSRFSGMPRWTGQAQLLQGDSRRLSAKVAGAGLVVGSPPFMETSGGGKGPVNGWNKTGGLGGNGPAKEGYAAQVSVEYGSTPGQLATLPPGTPPTAIISSPPFAGNSGGRGDASRNGIDAALFDRHSGGMKKGTGSDPANLDHLRQGDIQAVIGSPPYAESITNRSETTIEGDRKHRERIGRNPDSGGSLPMQEYGRSDGQLGAMKAGEVAAVVGSPPFENSLNSREFSEEFMQKRHEIRRANGVKGGDSIMSMDGTYGSTAGQIGATQGQTFWEAARLIVEQCALLLPPGGAAIWVTKRYIKSGQIVDFSQQWAQLCEACGFEIVHWHRAMLVKDGGNQADIFGNDHKKTIAKKSFFRRLAEKNGSPPIDWEDVICTRKPA